jgi:threonine synthase
VDHPDPVRPDTIAKSIAIGNPADGFQVIEVIKETGGWAEMASDDEIRAGIHLLAETEGIFTEPAGGTTIAVTRKLIEMGRIPRDESIVVCITGNGYKTSEVVSGGIAQPIPLGRSFKEFEAWYAAAPAEVTA